MKLTDVVDRINGNVDRFTTELEYYIGGEHFESNELEVTQKGLLKENLGKLGFKFHFAFQDRDVVFMARNPHLRKAGMVRFAGLCSDASYILRSKDETVLSQEYLAVMLQSDHFWDYCESHKVGSVNFANNWSSIANYEFELPTPEEQKEISDKVWAAYRLKKSYKKLLAATEEMVKSQFIEMFGDPVSWQTDTSLPTLNDTVNVISGFPFDSEKFDTEGVGTPLIRIRDIQRGYSETFTTEVFDEQYRIKKNELLVGMDGMFDIARWQSDEAALNQRVCCLRMKGSENDTFIQYLVQPILKHIENGTNATTVKHISTKQINGIRVPIASHEQKNKFAMIANQADKSGFRTQQIH